MDLVGAIAGGIAAALILAIGIRVFWRLDGEWVLRHIARRCDIHDRAYPLVIRTLESELGFEPGTGRGGFVENHCDPELIDCGREWCRRQRQPAVIRHRYGYSPADRGVQPGTPPSGPAGASSANRSN